MSRTKKLANQTKGYLSEKIPKERREQAIWRLKKMVIEVQGHADCRFQTAFEEQDVAYNFNRPASY